MKKISENRASARVELDGHPPFRTPHPRRPLGEQKAGREIAIRAPIQGASRWRNAAAMAEGRPPFALKRAL
jgi:hypothetical protein